MNHWLAQLNKSQYEAVVSKSKYLYLVSRAGTEKTTTLTSKTAYLITKQNVSSKHILALAFNNKADDQMKQKLLGMIGEQSKAIIVCIFYSLGNRIFKKFIHLLPFGYQTNFSITDSIDCDKILKNILKEMQKRP